MSLDLDHVAIAVPHLDAAARTWCELLHAEPLGPPEEVPDQGVRERHLRAGSLVLQLLEPTTPDSPVGRFLARRGPGLHHLAVRVTDLEATLGRLRAQGLRLIDEAPRPGSRGTRIAFLHPEATGGVLVELVETCPAHVPPQEARGGAPEGSGSAGASPPPEGPTP